MVPPYASSTSRNIIPLVLPPLNDSKNGGAILYGFICAMIYSNRGDVGLRLSEANHPHAPAHKAARYDRWQRSIGVATTFRQDRARR